MGITLITILCIMLFVSIQLRKNLQTLMQFQRFRSQFLSMIILLFCGFICSILVIYNGFIKSEVIKEEVVKNISSSANFVWNNETLWNYIHVLIWIVGCICLSATVGYGIYLYKKYIPKSIKTKDNITNMLRFPTKKNGHGVYCSCPRCSKLLLEDAFKNHSSGCSCPECQKLFASGQHP